MGGMDREPGMNRDGEWVVIACIVAMCVMVLSLMVYDVRKDYENTYTEECVK